jgi:hypothetical protein
VGGLSLPYWRWNLRILALSVRALSSIQTTIFYFFLFILIAAKN